MARIFVFDGRNYFVIARETHKNLLNFQISPLPRGPS